MQVRALIEGQFLSMHAHAERFGLPSPPKRIIATGGASANQSILSSIASIFGCDIYTVQRPGTLSSALVYNEFICSLNLSQGNKLILSQSLLYYGLDLRGVPGPKCMAHKFEV